MKCVVRLSLCFAHSGKPERAIGCKSALFTLDRAEIDDDWWGTNKTWTPDSSNMVLEASMDSLHLSQKGLSGSMGLVTTLRMPVEMIALAQVAQGNRFTYIVQPATLVPCR